MPRFSSKDTPHGPVSLEDAAWTAGFIEGEGTLDWHARTLRVGAYQVNEEPLLRLKSIWGGNIYYRKQRDLINFRYKRQPIGHWYVYGSKARRLVQYVLPLLSAKRQKQYADAIEKSMVNHSR